MKTAFSREEEKELLDKVIEIANIIHESGITVAENLGLPHDIVMSLRERSPRAALVGVCDCTECRIKPEEKTVKKLSKKRTCNDCKALEFGIINNYCWECSLGYKVDINDAIPLEPCPKPKTTRELVGYKKKI